MAAGRFVLENNKGQVVRTFDWEDVSVYVILRQDTHRQDDHFGSRKLRYHRKRKS